MIDEPMAQDQALATIQRIVEQRQAEPEPFTKLVRRMRLAIRKSLPRIVWGGTPPTPNTLLFLGRKPPTW